jgi:predicted alpha-1,6-mannanase (GH76 family)
MNKFTLTTSFPLIPFPSLSLSSSGWNATCGGVNWWSNNAYVNTITNGLAFTGLVSLQRVTGSVAPLQGKPLLDWTELIWKWANQPGLLNSDGVFIDGFGKDCITPGGAPWTYNTGIWLDGLTGLSIALNNASYSDAAFTLAKNSALFFAGGNEDGVLREVSCGGTPVGNCTGADGREFKGVFVRHLAYAMRDWEATGTAASNAEAAAWARQWVIKHLDSLLQNDASVASGGTVLFGQFYQGPFQEDNTMWISHSAGNDIVLAGLEALMVAKEEGGYVGK